MDTFASLGLSEPILKAIAETGYETPTPIQLQAIPPVLAPKDVLGIAQTGTGKTAAFALPILHRLAADRKPTPRRGARALILSPTRELASQIADSFRTYGKHLGFSVVVVFGGVSERPQAEKLQRGVDILVATPGRLLDHVGQKNVSLGETEIFVLDEADQMLDLGFFKPIRRIVSELPKARQSLFFSATMPKEIEDLTRELLKDPVKVAVAPASTTVERVTQRVIRVEQSKKKALLAELLADEKMHRTLVFTRTKRGADRVAKHLTGAKIEAAAIHGNKSQNQREAALHSFKSGHTRVLVATDIAARGIDIDEVTHVVNFELPEVPEAYVHRIGRTARAGASGAAISFCDEGERHLLRDIEKVTRQTLEAEDRRGDANLAVDKAPARGERPTGEPRDGERPSEARREHKRFSDRERGRGGDRGEGRRERFARSDRGERGGERRESGLRGDRPPRADRPAGDRKPWESRDGRGSREGGERRFQRREGDRPRQDRPPQSRDRAGGDRPGGDRDRSSVWTNDGSSPDRQHRTEQGRGDRPERRDGERREFRGHSGGGERGGFRGPRRDGDRPNREGGERRPWNRDERAPRDASAREGSGERREWKPRPPRDGARVEGLGPRPEGARGVENRGPRRPDGERGERREGRSFEGGRGGPRRDGFKGGEGRRDGERQDRRPGGFDRDRPRQGGGEQRPRDGEGGAKRPHHAGGQAAGRPEFRKPREGGKWRGRDDKRPPRRDADNA